MKVLSMRIVSMSNLGIIALCLFASICSLHAMDKPAADSQRGEYKIISTGTITGPAWDRITEFAKKHGASCFALFDIDDTAMTSVPPYCRNGDVFGPVLDYLEAQPNADELKKVLFTGLEYRPVEEEFPALLPTLKSYGSKVWGLTARGVGNLTATQSVEDFVHRKLTSDAVGVHFDQHDLKLHILKKDPERNAFKHGIAFCHPYTKGFVLRKIIEQWGEQPEGIIMIDDVLENLTNIRDELKKHRKKTGRPISFLGVHYRAAAERLDNTVNFAHVGKQVGILVHHSKYCPWGSADAEWERLGYDGGAFDKVIAGYAAAESGATQN